VTSLIDSLEHHKAFFADIKSTGGTASIVIQFMDGFLADEIPLATLAKLVDLELSLGVECFTDVER
jgi:hypothetical protein